MRARAECAPKMTRKVEAAQTRCDFEVMRSLRSSASFVEQFACAPHDGRHAAWRPALRRDVAVKRKQGLCHVKYGLVRLQWRERAAKVLDGAKHGLGEAPILRVTVPDEGQRTSARAERLANGLGADLEHAVQQRDFGAGFAVV